MKHIYPGDKYRRLFSTGLVVEVTASTPAAVLIKYKGKHYKIPRKDFEKNYVLQ